MSSKYILVSLPRRAFETSDPDDAVSSLAATVTPDNGTVVPFNIPDFKIGTLDALVQQADDLAKLESSCKTVVAKVHESLKAVFEGDEERMAQYQMVNDSASLPWRGTLMDGMADSMGLEPTEQFLNSFSWNKVRYRADRPLVDLIDILQKVSRHVASRCVAVHVMWLII